MGKNLNFPDFPISLLNRLVTIYKYFMRKSFHPDWIEYFIKILKKNFCSAQLFFIGYGRGWCETKTIQALVRQLITDPHPPAMVRVRATLRNFEEFQNAFQCNDSDKMVGKPRCRIW